MNSPVPSDVWFDCCNNVSGDDVFAGLVLSDSDNDSTDDVHFIPCIGRGLPVPSVCEVKLPKAAFCCDVKVGRPTKGRGRGQILQNRLDQLMGSVECDYHYSIETETDMRIAENLSRQLDAHTVSHRENNASSLNEEHFPSLVRSTETGSKAILKYSTSDTKTTDDDKNKPFSLKEIASQFKN